jgi:hypothetical protein
MQRLKTNWWTLAAGVLGAWLLFQPASARAGTFDNSSLSGPFGLQLNKFGTCPNIVTVVGLLNFDGTGGVTGSFNQYTSDRGGTGPKTSSGNILGIYTVNPDGTGTMSLTSPKIGTFAFVLDSTATSAERIELINTSSHSWTCAMSGYAIQQ